MGDVHFDFNTDYHSPNKIFLLVGNGTAWDVYPDRPMSIPEFLKMMRTVFNLDHFQDSETEKFRIFWDEPTSSYMQFHRYVLETDDQFTARQQRLRKAGDRQARRQTMEQQAASIIDAIPEHLKELVRNKIGGR